MRTFSIVLTLTLIVPLAAQERVKPAGAKGGKGFGEPWTDVPEAYKKIKIPEWPVPTDLANWQKDRVHVRATLVKCMGDLPARPDPRKVVGTFKEEKDDYTIERFEFFNGVDQTVHGVILIPKGLKKPAPAIICSWNGFDQFDRPTEGRFTTAPLAHDAMPSSIIDAFVAGPCKDSPGRT
jgi:hypothetical protein